MLWDDVTAPRKGWYVACVEDLGPDPRGHQCCEACGKVTVRYLHVLRHVDYGQDVLCGCECAAKMVEDPASVYAAEKHAVNIARRRATFSNLSGWVRANNGSGNLRLKKDGLICVIASGKFGGFTGSFKSRNDPSAGWLGTGRYVKTEDEAKADLFEAIVASGYI